MVMDKSAKSRNKNLKEPLFLVTKVESLSGILSLNRDLHFFPLKVRNMQSFVTYTESDDLQQDLVMLCN